MKNTNHKKIIFTCSCFSFFFLQKEAKLISKINNINKVYEVESNDPNKKSYGNWVGDFFARIG